MPTNYADEQVVWKCSNCEEDYAKYSANIILCTAQNHGQKENNEEHRRKRQNT
jgi:hypothetical protein